LKEIKQAKRYANALLRNVGIENAQQAISEISVVNELMGRSKEFKSLLINPQFTSEERKKVITQISKKRKVKAVVMTPIEISKDYENTLRSSLKKVTDRDVDIEYVMDPSLLGGILIKMGSTMYDTSLKGQLRLLKDELIKR